MIKLSRALRPPNLAPPSLLLRGATPSRLPAHLSARWRWPGRGAQRIQEPSSGPGELPSSRRRPRSHPSLGRTRLPRQTQPRPAAAHTLRPARSARPFPGTPRLRWLPAAAVLPRPGAPPREAGRDLHGPATRAGEIASSLICPAVSRKTAHGATKDCIRSPGAERLRRTWPQLLQPALDAGRRGGLGNRR